MKLKPFLTCSQTAYFQKQKMEEIKKEIEKTIAIANKIKQIENKQEYCLSTCRVNHSNGDIKTCAIKKSCGINEGDNIIVIKVDSKFQKVSELLKTLEQVNLEEELNQRDFLDYDSIIGEDGVRKKIQTDNEHRRWMKQNNSKDLFGNKI